MLKRVPLLALAATLMAVGPASATSFSFARVTDNGNVDVGSQLMVEVTAFGNQVDFTFTNDVGIASSITDIYFDDGTLLGIAEIFASSGVSFAYPAKPGDLPGGGSISPAFEATQNFSADSDPAVMPNGVNASDEWVTIRFNLQGAQTYADTIAALESGDLRVGLHVQAIGPTGGSDSYVNTVPDGGMTLTLMGGTLLGLAAFRRRFRA